jgi:hypothetical protein
MHLNTVTVRKGESKTAWSKGEKFFCHKWGKKLDQGENFMLILIKIISKKLARKEGR